jgi:methionyl-tRNA formyltransferase
VAAKSLHLLAQKFNIEAVITKPRPVHHRGSVPVLEVAGELSIPVLTVASGKDLNSLMSTKPVKSQLAVLIDFGIIVSKPVIDYFPLGIINSHFSVLPDLRGADPITFAILSGQKKTGVSLMMLVEAMDEGPLIAYSEFVLPPSITTPELTSELILISDSLLNTELPRVFNGQARALPQSVTGRAISYSRRLVKQDGELDWSRPAEQLERQIRAYLGWPGSHMLLAGKDVTITAAHIVPEAGKPGTVQFNKRELIVYASQDALAIDRLKPAGKKEMSAQAFFSGYGKDLAL